MGPSRFSNTAHVWLIAGALLAAAHAGCANSRSQVSGVHAAVLLPPPAADATTSNDPPAKESDRGIVRVAAQDHLPQPGKDKPGKPAEAPGPRGQESKAPEPSPGADKDSAQEEKKTKPVVELGYEAT